MGSLFKDMKFRAKTPRGLAVEIKRMLIKTFELDPDYVYVWSPKESAERGYSKAWTVVSEDAPFEWAPDLTGYNETIAFHPTVFVECDTNYKLNLYPQRSI